MNQQGACSRENSEEFYWKSIWNMSILDSMKQISWRACNNLFPTKVNLAKKTVEKDNLCPICGNPKTILHALWECLATCDIWGEGVNPLR